MVGVAQRQSTGLWPQGPGVQIPSLTLAFWMGYLRRIGGHSVRYARQFLGNLLMVRLKGPASPLFLLAFFVPMWISIEIIARPPP